jgi:hypothetical protein
MQLLFPTIWPLEYWLYDLSNIEFLESLPVLTPISSAKYYRHLESEHLTERHSLHSYRVSGSDDIVTAKCVRYIRAFTNHVLSKPQFNTVRVVCVIYPRSIAEEGSRARLDFRVTRVIPDS